MRDPLFWFDLAACKGMNRDLWINPGNQHVAQMAIEVCDRCPVKALCLDYGMSLELPAARHGIYGGTRPPQRVKLARAGVTQEIAHESYVVHRRLLAESLSAS